MKNPPPGGTVGFPTRENYISERETLLQKKDAEERERERVWRHDIEVVPW